MSTALNNAFIAQRHSLIWSVMRIVRDPQAAEDLAQEAFVRARQAVEARPIEHIEAFLHQTARNLALDHLRRRKTRDRFEGDDQADANIAAVEADVLDPEAECIERERFRVFLKVLAELPRQTQHIVMLSRVNGWSQARIAAHLGISERTAFNALKRAMAHCREAMIHHDLT
ncbi:sigma-70 family RNA polymerase sigma factor [Hyphomicrobium sp. D-2]|uniref:RNA polymerase sigma factor n=1 Tax=Hyphomicrobium sp. D-2 TaxID=3041621 RepID=UPI0024585E7C|nr:sigma-70 family RNA polymerase sigma factor [Hyphomicrobium sp. D-2]MDH4983706.1 sigma-70 family RNA polymerase sigma factor [Hyphomicrobium sp. D-2]